MSFRLGHKIAIVICTFCLCVTTAFAADFYAPFVGSGYVKGTDPLLGDVELYVPIDSKGSWGNLS